MNPIAPILVVICVGCAQTSRSEHTLPELYAMRERASNTRTFSIVGISLGVAAAVVGGILVAHGSDLRSRESSADNEDGLGSLLGGLLFTTGGGVLAVGAGVSLAVSSREYADIDAQIRARSDHTTTLPRVVPWCIASCALATSSNANE